MALRRICTLLALLLLISTSSAAQGRVSTEVSLAWDRNPEPDAAGYFVYVGTLPGVYNERIDVGQKTTFVYNRPGDGQRYYFAVAAYTSAGLVGPLSQFVSHVSGSSPSAFVSDPAATLRTDRPDTTTPNASSPNLPSLICLEGTRDCYQIRPLMRTSTTIEAVVSTPNGQVLAIADGRHVLVHAPGGRIHRALTVHDRTLTGLAIDPSYDRTHFVYIAEARDDGDGTWETAIVRYREVEGTLGDPVVIVNAIPVMGSRPLPFTVGADGNIYVATAAAGSSPDPYHTSVLRFTREGRLPSDAPNASPVYAEGLAHPAALAFDSSGRYLWIAGTDGINEGRLAYLDIGTNTRAWPRQTHSVSLGRSAGRLSDAAAFLLTAEGRLLRCTTTTVACAGIRELEGYRSTAVAQGSAGRAYVAVVTNGSSTILELRPASPLLNTRYED